MGQMSKLFKCFYLPPTHTPTKTDTYAIWYLSVTGILPICTCSHIHLLLLGHHQLLFGDLPSKILNMKVKVISTTYQH